MQEYKELLERREFLKTSAKFGAVASLVSLSGFALSVRIHPLAVLALRRLIELAVNTVVEVITFYIFKVIRFIHRLKQIVHQAAVGDHGPAGIKEQKQLYRILSGLFHDDLQAAAVVAGLIHSPRNIKLRLRNIKLCGKLSEPPERQLKLPVVQYSVIPEILIFSGPDHRESRSEERRVGKECGS